MAAVGAELAGAGDADVDSAIVYGRRTGGHGVGIALRILDNDFLVVQDLTGIPVDLGVAQNAALGGKEHPVGLGIMGNVGAQVAADTLVGVELLAGEAVEDQQRGAVGVVTACAVIGADDGKLVGDVGARPVEAARSGVSPAGVLDLGSGGVIFVNGIDAGEVGVSVLAVPEACVDVAVLVGDGAVGLTAQLVGVDPQGFQRLGIECLNFAAGQANEDHAVAISHGDDGVAGLINHGAFGHRLAGHAVETADGASGVGVDVAIDHDGRTGGSRPAGAVLHSPQNFRVLGGVGGLGVGDTQIVVALAEVAPLGSDASVEVRVLRGHSQSNVDGAAFAELEGALLADIAVALHEVGVLGVSHDGILAVRGSNSVLVGIPDSYLGVGGVNGEADLDGCQSGNGDGVGVGIAAGVGDDHVDLVLTKIQRNGGIAAAVDGDGVAFITGSRRNGNALGGSGRGVSRLGSGESLREPDAVQRQGGQARRNTDGGELVLILEVAVHNGDGHGVDLRAGGCEACQILAAGFAGGQSLCLLGINVEVYPLGRDGRAAASVVSLGRPCVEHVGVVRHEHGVFLDRRVESRNQLEHLRLGLGACVAELQNGQAGRLLNGLGHALDGDGQVGGNILNGVGAVFVGRQRLAVGLDRKVIGLLVALGDSDGEAVAVALQNGSLGSLGGSGGEAFAIRQGDCDNLFDALNPDIAIAEYIGQGHDSIAVLHLNAYGAGSGEGNVVVVVPYRKALVGSYLELVIPTLGNFRVGGGVSIAVTGGHGEQTTPTVGQRNLIEAGHALDGDGQVGSNILNRVGAVLTRRQCGAVGFDHKAIAGPIVVVEFQREGVIRTICHGGLALQGVAPAGGQCHAVRSGLLFHDALDGNGQIGSDVLNRVAAAFTGRQRFAVGLDYEVVFHLVVVGDGDGEAVVLAVLYRGFSGQGIALAGGQGNRMGQGCVSKVKEFGSRLVLLVNVVCHAHSN